MATVQRSAARVAWSAKRQSAFGTALVKTDLTRYLRLQDPIIINENAEHWNDRGAIGTGHDWETQRGKISQHVQFEIPVQPVPVDFAGYLVALIFSDVSTDGQDDPAYVHTTKFQPLASRPQAYTTSLAVQEDGNDYYLQDVACTSLTIRGAGSNRMEMGGSFVASRIGGTLESYSWPQASALKYLYNYAGTFSIDGTDRKSQIRSFELSLESGINMGLAWSKAASEADRIYPSAWPYTPERNMGLTLRILAEGNNLAVFRNAQQVGSEDEIVISCLGVAITGTANPVVFDELEITVPRAVYTGVDQSYDDGLLHLDLNIEGHFDSTAGGPIEIAATNNVTEYLAT
ncbi:MAG: hypothetical protein U9P14_04930 [Gemmatimonadota bacterium]|nr:hypothetical protein [Gemmatimonadota bacterium]